jgi:hypothetical protein
MEYLKKLMEKKNLLQLILVILFIIYLVFGIKMPNQFAETMDTSSGKIIVWLVAMILFVFSNPILGILGLIVAYELIKRSGEVTGTTALKKYYPTEQKKWSPFTPRHQFPYTLEQEVVKKMAPIRQPNYTKSKYTYKPILDNLYDAAPVNYTGVV